MQIQICNFYESKFTKAAQIHFSMYVKILASHNNQVREDEDEKDRKSIMDKIRLVGDEGGQEEQIYKLVTLLALRFQLRNS